MILAAKDDEVILYPIKRQLVNFSSFELGSKWLAAAAAKKKKRV